MFRFLFREHVEHAPFLRKGSEATVIGKYGVSEKPGDFRPEWFPGKHTLILGTTAEDNQEKHHATWNIEVDRRLKEVVEGGFLIIASQREFAGLHTSYRKPDAKDIDDVKIFLNETPIDSWKLRVRPKSHTDYFHVEDTKGGDVKGLLRSVIGMGAVHDCKTVYSFAVSKEKLRDEPVQTVRIELDSKVMWDIDYVVLLLRRSGTELKPAVVKAIWMALGAAFGVAGTLLSKLLTR